MISKELKNDFREMIFGTFCAGFEDVIYSWEKNHFLRKWAFPEMDGNHFFPENARQPPEFLTKVLIEATKNFFSQKLKRYIKILFPTDFFNGLGAFRTRRVRPYNKN